MPRKRQAARTFRREGELSNDQVIKMLMCGGDQDWTEAEVEALRENLCGDPNGRKMFERFEEEYKARKQHVS